MSSIQPQEHGPESGASSAVRFPGPSPQHPQPSDQSRPPGGYRWFVFTNLWVQGLVLMIPIGTLGLVLPALQQDLDFSTSEAGWLGSVRFLGPALLTLLASVYLSRMTGAGTYALLLAMSGASVIVIGFVPSFEFLIVALALHSTVAAFSQIPVPGIRLRWIVPAEFGLVMGLTLAFAAGGQSAALAFIPFLLPLVGGWRAMFLGTGALMLGVAVAWPLVMRGGRGRDVGRSGAIAIAPQLRFRQALLSAARHREFTLIGLAMLANGGTWMGFQLFLPSYLNLERGIDLRTVGMIVSVMPLGGIAGTLGAGWISDRIGLRRPPVWGFALAQPPTYLLMIAPLDSGVLMVVAFVLGVAAWGPVTPLMTVAHEVPGSTVDDVVIGQALMGTVMTSGNLGTPLIITTIAAAAGSLQMGLAAIGLLPVAVIVVAWLLPETGSRGPHRQQAARPPVP